MQDLCQSVSSWNDIAGLALFACVVAVLALVGWDRANATARELVDDLRKEKSERAIAVLAAQTAWHEAVRLRRQLGPSACPVDQPPKES